MHRPVYVLDGVIRDYPWGSRTAIQDLLSLPHDDRPAAELWFGAHPDDPSPVQGETVTLEALVAADPLGLLGAEVLHRFGDELPFLAKVLAAETPLSMQVHPNRDQARAGFAAEQAAGIARDAPERNYRDANHKPELLCALEPFEALCGFAPIASTLAMLDELDLPQLSTLRVRLAGPDGLRAAFTGLLAEPNPGPLVDAVVAATDRLDGTAWAGSASAVRHCAAAFPGDVGIVLALLLNPVLLAPGEAIFLPAGNVHAYLHGVGLEVLANSDNVLRCGLTGKHVDVPELLAITDFSELVEPRLPARQVGPGAWEYPVPVPDFALTRVNLDELDGAQDSAGQPGPELIVNIRGRLTVSVDGQSVEVAPGHAAFVPTSGVASWLWGSADTYRVTAHPGSS